MESWSAAAARNDSIGTTRVQREREAEPLREASAPPREVSSLCSDVKLRAAAARCHQRERGQGHGSAEGGAVRGEGRGGERAAALGGGHGLRLRLHGLL